jgi:hypothetical protein
MTWTLNDKEFTSDMIGDYVGFVYEIEVLDTGMKYIGKKLFQFKKTTTKKGKKKRSLVESDWQTYTGSNDVLNEQVKAGAKVKRRILHLCNSKGAMSYYEIKAQLACDALLRDDYFNTFVGCKIHRKHVK